MKTFNSEEYLDNQKQLFKKQKVEKIKHSNLESLQKAESQGCLFHGTYSREAIKTLKLNTTNLSEHKVVFAGSLWVALCFTALWNDNTVSMGTVNNEPYLSIYDKEVHKAFLRGGFIYQVSPETFFSDDRLTNFEFISKESVKPISNVFIKDSLSLLVELGVKVELLY